MDDHSQMNRITFSNGKALAKRLTAFILCLILLSAQAAFPANAAEPGRTEASAASTAKMSKETSPAETDSAEASSAGTDSKNTDSPKSESSGSDTGAAASAAQTPADSRDQKETEAADGDKTAPASKDSNSAEKESAGKTEGSDTADKESAGNTEDSDTADKESAGNAEDSNAADKGSAGKTEGSDTADKGSAGNTESSDTADKGSAANTGDSSAGPEKDSGKAAEEAPESAPAKEAPAENAGAGTAGSGQTDIISADPASEVVQTPAMLRAVTTSDFENAITLHVGDQIPVNISISNPCRYFRFSPETSGMYYFYTDGTTGDAYGELYDDKAVLLAECDDIVEGDNRNFGIVYPCQAGRDYYLRARQYNYGPDSFTVSVSKEESSRPQVYRVGDRNRTFTPGAEASLSVSAHSDSPFTYVWTWDTYARSVQDGIPGADSETFTFKVERTGVLHCTVIDKEDPSLWDNCTFLISIDNKLKAWPEGNNEDDPNRTIITGPGKDISLRTMVSAVETDQLSFQWYRMTDDGDEPIEGADSDTYTVPAGSPSSYYYCAVSDPYGGERTVVFNTRINHLRVYPEGCRKSETSRTLIVKKDDPARLAVAVDADSKEGLVYRWYRQYPSDETLIEGADKSSWTIPKVTEAEGIVCIVTDPYGNSGFCYFYITFQDLQVWPEGGQPGDWSIEYNVKAGDSLTLAAKVSPEETGPLTYRWLDNDYEEIPGADGPSFRTPAIKTNSTYTCEVSDSYGNTESCYFLVYTNHLKAWPEGAKEGSDTADVSVAYGEPAQLKVHVSADDPEGISYVWIDSEYDTIEGEVSDSLTTGNITRPTSYSCLVSDTYGNETYVYFKVSSNHLTARAEGDEEDGIFTVVYVEAGEDAVLRVTADSDTPDEIGYRWYDGRSGSYFYDKTEYDSFVTLENCTSNTQWRCMVYDPYGNQINLFFLVRINNHLKAYPAGTSENTTETTVRADENGHVDLEVTTEAANTAGIRYMWYYGPVVDETPGLSIEENSSHLQDTITEKTDYTCLVRDVYGNEKTIIFHALPTEKEHVHTWAAPVYTWADVRSAVTASRTCEDCGETATETVSTSSEVTKPASCEAAGETKYTAVFSNEAFSQQEKVTEAPAPLGHDWGPWTVTKKATLTQEGTEERTCTRCGEKQTRSTEKLKEQEKPEKSEEGSPSDSGSSGKHGSSSKSGGSSKSGSRASSPRTGDESPVMVWISLAVISAAGLTVLLRLRRRTK